MKKTQKSLVTLVVFMAFVFTNFIGLFANMNVFANTLPINITIKTGETEIPSGRFVSFDLKYEVTSYNVLKEEETIEIEIPESLTNVSLVYSKQHFKSAMKEGNKYTLTFGANASTALVGYIGLGAIASNEDTQPKEAVVNVINGDKKASAKITILPLITGVAGEETRTVVKFTDRYLTNAAGEYTYVQQGANEGIMYSNCNELKYIIEVNPKHGNLSNAVLKDFLPYEMELIDSSIKFMSKKDEYYENMPSDSFPIIKNKNNLMIKFGDVSSEQQYRVEYRVKVLNNQLKLSNAAKIEYVENGQNKVEMQDFYVKPYNYAGAINGYKMVDKSIISNAKEDQTVVYTIVFQNDNVFAKGEVNLIDKLDSRIKFVDAIATEEFAVKYDANTHSVYVENSNGDIPAGVRREVKIITDFTDVKPGETVKNSVGANTAVTKKKYMYQFKNVDSITGEPAAGGTFKVVDKNGNEVLQNIVTGSDGIGIIELLTEGEYELIETKAPTGYELNTTPISFQVTENVSKPLEILVKNNSQKIQVSVVKVDKDNNSKVLPGAQFQIKNSQGEVTATIVTDENGLARTSLIPGEYTLQEIKAPDLYELFPEIKNFSVVLGQTSDIKILFENKIKHGSFTIKKADNLNDSILLKGTVFTIKDKNGNFVKDITIDENGQAKIFLEPGEYIITGKEAPVGYKFSSKEINFIIKHGQDVSLNFQDIEMMLGEVQTPEQPQDPVEVQAPEQPQNPVDIQEPVNPTVLEDKTESPKKVEVVKDTNSTEQNKLKQTDSKQRDLKKNSSKAKFSKANTGEILPKTGTSVLPLLIGILMFTTGVFTLISQKKRTKRTDRK